MTTWSRTTKFSRLAPSPFHPAFTWSLNRLTYPLPPWTETHSTPALNVPSASVGATLVVYTTQDNTASYTPRFCERKLPESLLQRTSPLLKYSPQVAVNQNTPAMDTDILCIIISSHCRNPLWTDYFTYWVTNHTQPFTPCSQPRMYRHHEHARDTSRFPLSTTTSTWFFTAIEVYNMHMYFKLKALYS
jgi:hypothetical protein